VAALDAATLGCPVDESLELVAMTPAKPQEFSGVEIGGFPAQKSFETPLDIGATPRREAIAARGNPIKTNRPKHAYTSIGAGVISVEDSWMEARKIFLSAAPAQTGVRYEQQLWWDWGRMPGDMKRREILVGLALTALGAFAGWMAAGAQENGKEAPEGTRLRDVAVPMRDGVILRADVWLPKVEGRFPTLVYRTPYGKQFAAKEWTTFDKAVAHGYAVVIEDVRGRYASDGEFVPYQNEGKDGYDTIEWAAKQEWSDGKVGTFGLSYPGAVQWLAAVESPPHLKAMVPAMTFRRRGNFSIRADYSMGRGWVDLMNIAPDARQRRTWQGRRRTRRRGRRGRRNMSASRFLPLMNLTDLKEAAPFYYQWLAHLRRMRGGWAELRNKYDRVAVRCVFVRRRMGRWATTNFNGLLAARKGWNEPATRTIIGPWTHGGEDEQKSGEREFGPTAPVDYDGLILRWMDHYMRGAENGVEKEAPVRIFVMGKNAWRDEKAWPIERAEERSYYLVAESDAARQGTLSQRVGTAKSTLSTLVSDPAHPVTDAYTAYGAHDYRALAGRKDVLVFDSEVMKQDMEVTGPIRAEMYVSADVKDFDLWVRLLDVAPDGTAFNLMSPGLDELRASCRDETVQPKVVEPGKIYRLELNRMLTSNTFLEGHRIRVQISGAFYPHFSRNLQTGESEIYSAEMKVGTLKIHHDAGHASRIGLPVVGSRGAR
jgi:predicted acyl esterase